MDTIKLSKRLAVIAAQIEQDAAVADIGTDHGYLPVYLAQTGTASYITASDIAEGPIEAARRNAKSYGVEHCIEFVTAPGLKGVCLTRVDTVVIAGMGGETIAGIISDTDFPAAEKCFTLILQPQSKLDYLCRTIAGFYLKTASLVRDAGRIYAVMTFVSGKPDYSVDGYYRFLSVLRENGDVLFPEYLQMLVLKEKRVLESLGQSHNTEMERHAAELKLLLGLSHYGADPYWIY